MDDTWKTGNYDHIVAYLAYNKHCNPIYYFSTLDEQNWDGEMIHLDYETVENWYPKTLSERIDVILFYIYKHTKHIGQTICFSKEELFSFLFLDRCVVPYLFTELRSEEDLRCEGAYMLECLAKQGYIEDCLSFLRDETQNLRLTPQGYTRIDEIQRNTANGKNVLVAMKFGKETIPLREAIRDGVQKAGYIAVFIDEV